MGWWWVVFCGGRVVLVGGWWWWLPGNAVMQEIGRREGMRKRDEEERGRELEERCLRKMFEEEMLGVWRWWVKISVLLKTVWGVFCVRCLRIPKIGAVMQ